MNNKKTIYAVCLLLLVTVISIGYALISGTLNINGSAKITAAKWDLFFSRLEIINGSELENNESKITNKTKVTFDIDLNTPGDYYEFNVDVVNNGDLDAMIDKITITPDISDKSYLSYTVKYLDDSDVEEKDILHSKKARTIKVRVEYLKTIENNELNSSEQTLNMSFEMKYVQADATGKEPTASDKPACQYEIGQVFEFPYNGTSGAAASIQEFEVPCNGKYKLEVWGAQGGNNNYQAAGGYGGYSSGYVDLTDSETLFIACGQAGSFEGGATFNGGGAGAVEDSTWGAGSGGGATHIALVDGTLASIGYEEFVTNGKGLIVAGGGGGASRNADSNSLTGGTGGGLTGGGAASASFNGGTQTGGYSFGVGQNGSSASMWSGGGGGGLFGGTSVYRRGGGGGSGYIGGVVDGETQNGVRSGHGYARITYLGY